MIFNKYLDISVVGIAVMTIVSNWSMINIAKAEEIRCQGSLGRITVDNLKVLEGKICHLQGTTVKGNIVVNNGAILKASYIKVNGNIEAEGARAIHINYRTIVGGNIKIKQGESVRIINSNIKGDIQLESNFRNVIISQNYIGGNLQCKQNQLYPIGGNNIVDGNKEDQCANL